MRVATTVRSQVPPPIPSSPGSLYPDLPPAEHKEKPRRKLPAIPTHPLPDQQLAIPAETPVTPSSILLDTHYNDSHTAVATPVARRHQARSSSQAISGSTRSTENKSLSMTIKPHARLKQSLVPGLHPQTVLLPEVSICRSGDNPRTCGTIHGMGSTFRTKPSSLHRGPTSTAAPRRVELAGPSVR